MMADRIASLWPELTLFGTVCLVLITGLARDRDIRSLTLWLAGAGVLAALAAALRTPEIAGSPLPGMAGFVKPAVCALGLLLLLMVPAVDAHLEERFKAGRPFDALAVTQGEFVAFFLLSLTGVLLTTTATDLIWLFLALELTSLPTYLMAARGRRSDKALEAAVKYFFLGAFAAGILIFGFALLYGATGTMHLEEIAAALARQAAGDGVSPLAVGGLVLTIAALAFKIAAFPMHFYVADVYQGVESGVAAFLAFVPKTAGLVALLLVTDVARGDGPMPEAVHAVLWLIAAATMILGNTLALWQRSAKRILAYSSMAHSGYMLLGVIAGAGAAHASPTNGYAAVLAYLCVYGVMNTGAFAVIGCLSRGEEEAEDLADLSGLSRQSPGLALVMSVCALSLLGLPPLVGFLTKLHLFSAALSAGEVVLVIIAGLSSAISAWYYLKLAGLPWLGVSEEAGPDRSGPTRRAVAGVVSAAIVVLLIMRFAPLVDSATQAMSAESHSKAHAELTAP